MNPDKYQTAVDVPVKLPVNPESDLATWKARAEEQTILAESWRLKLVEETKLYNEACRKLKDALQLAEDNAKDWCELSDALGQRGKMFEEPLEKIRDMIAQIGELTDERDKLKAVFGELDSQARLISHIHQQVDIYTEHPCSCTVHEGGKCTCGLKNEHDKMKVALSRLDEILKKVREW